MIKWFAERRKRRAIEQLEQLRQQMIIDRIQPLLTQIKPGYVHVLYLPAEITDALAKDISDGLLRAVNEVYEETGVKAGLTVVALNRSFTIIAGDTIGTIGKKT